MESNWILKDEGDTATIHKLMQELNVSKPIATMLVQRGINTFDEAKRFFRPDLKHLHDPFLMADMDKAVQRLNQAIANKEKILVYGDYDVDGTTSVALVYSFLRKIVTDIDYYIPDRYNEGYGISFKGIDFAKENNFDLVIALDCGIKAVDKIEYANENNIDFIICDHHTAGDKIPEAVAVLDPKRKDCNYPYKELSGCGVGFKLLQAYSQQNSGNFEELYSYLDIVAISIASDIVPITGENRVLAYYGLKELNRTKREGLKAIIEVAGLKDKKIIISDCVFKIGPRINAAGRIESGRSAVKLLISDDKEPAEQFSKDINDFNVTRQGLDKSITQEALQMIEDNKEWKLHKATILYKEDWHKGVVGIVASRIIEHYYKPTIVLTKSKGMASGSARSVDGFDLYAAIDACSDLLESFGGHKHAAGLSIKIENIDKFRLRFNKVVSSMITAEQQIPKIEIDAKLSFKEITPNFFNVIRQFAPFGPGNMTPVYVTENVMDTGFSRAVGADKSHLQLNIKDSSHTRMKGIAFGVAEKYLPAIKQKKSFDICYSIEENEWQGVKILQLMVREIKISD
ncbi:MAG: single-stranded-DNA-specific exonuclease RecJ [Bacteroidales bacterium]|nr:single-stranded-DNA-specific exonuclease RecJ [Bacteroidales bacterium]